MDNHGLALEARLQSLQQQIQDSLTLFTSAAAELEHLRGHVRRTGPGAAEVLLGQPIANPYQQLQGIFQPRSPDGPWKALNAIQGLPDGDHCSGAAHQHVQSQHQDTACQLQETACQLNSTRRPVGLTSQGTFVPATFLNPRHASGLAQGIEAPAQHDTAEQEDGEPSPTADSAEHADGGAAAPDAELAVAVAVGGPYTTGPPPNGQQQQKASAGKPDYHQQTRQTKQHHRPQQQEPARRQQYSPESSASIASADADSRLLEGQSTADSSCVSNEQQTVDPGPSQVDRLQLPTSSATGTANALPQQDVAGLDDTHTGMLRVPLPGDPSGFRTAATYNNDPWWLAASKHRGPGENQDMPEELLSASDFVAHREGQLAEMLAVLSHARRELGWNLRADADDEDDEEQQQQQDEDSSIDMRISSQEQQQEEQEDTAAGDNATPVVRRRRKQTRPKHSPAAQRSVQLFSDSDSEDLQPRHTAFTELLQSLASVHAAPAAGIAAAAAAAAGTSAAAAAAAMGGFHSGEMQQAYAEMQQLVQEDVERLAQQWEQQERPKLQVVAADVWKEVHGKAAEWEQTVADRQSKLEDGMRELAKSHTDNVAAYKADRKRLSEALREWVFLTEGAKFVYSVAQLAEPPSAAEAAGLAAQAAAAAADKGAATRGRRGTAAAAAKSYGHSHGSASSSSRGGDNASNADDGFIDDADVPAAPAEAAAAVPSDAVRAKKQPVAAAAEPADRADSSSSSALDSGSDAEATDKQPAAWNIARVAIGSTQVLLGAKQLQRLQRQAALQQQGKQQLAAQATSEQGQDQQNLEEPRQHSQQRSSQQRSGSQQQDGEVAHSNQQQQRSSGEQQSHQAQDPEQTSQQQEAVDELVKPQSAQAASDVAAVEPLTGAVGSMDVGSAVAAEAPGLAASIAGSHEMADPSDAPVRPPPAAAPDAEGTLAGKPAADVTGVACPTPAEDANPAAAMDQQQDEPMQDAALLGAITDVEPVAARAAGDAAEQQQDGPLQTPAILPGDTMVCQPAAAAAAGDAAEQQQGDEPMQTAAAEQQQQQQQGDELMETAAAVQQLLPDVVDDDEEPLVVHRARSRSRLGSVSDSELKRPRAEDALQQAPADIQQQQQEREQQQGGAAMQVTPVEQQLLLDDVDSDEELLVVQRARSRSRLGSISGEQTPAHTDDQQVQQQQQQQQEPEQQVPLLEVPSVDDMDLPEQVSEAEEDEAAVPAGHYRYPAMVTTGPAEPGPLHLDQPCELLQGVTGGEHVTWMTMRLLQLKTVQPRWHSWQQATALLQTDQAAGTARLNLPGLIVQVPVDNIRPAPPEQLCNIIPLEQLADGPDAADWASSSAGLLHLTRALRPGVLLEIRKHSSSDWVPAVVLHSRMTRPALSDKAKDLLQQHSEAAAGTAAAAAGAAAGSSAAAAAGKGPGRGRGMRPAAAAAAAAAAGQKWGGRINTEGLVETGNSLRQGTSAAAAAGGISEGLYEAPDDDDVALVLLLLGSSFAGDVRHIKWGVLLEQPPRLRYMMHWRSKSVKGSDSSSDSESLEDKSDSDAVEPSDGSSSSSELPRKRRRAAARPAAERGLHLAAAGHQSVSSNAEADSPTVIQGSWQRLIKLKTLPVNRWARNQLQQEHRAWLKDLGWPIRGRRRAGAQQLSDQQLQQIARKLARRPTSAPVTPALKKAAGLESSRTRQGSKLQKWHRIRPRSLVGDTAGAAGQGGAASPAVPQANRKRGRRRRQQVVQDDSSDSDLPQPKAKRQRTRYLLRGQQQPAPDTDELDPSELGSLSPPPATLKPTRRRLSHAASAAAAAASSVSDSDADDWHSCSSSSEDGSSTGGAAVGGGGGKVAVSKELCLLYDDEPSGPLNPRLPRCWLTAGTAANQQVLKPHQLSGLRFMYDCLVREHSSAAIERRQQQQKQKRRKKQKDNGRRRRSRGAAAAADDDSDSDFQSIDDSDSNNGSEATASVGGSSSSSREDGTTSDQSEADDAGGCILAHSMGLGKSFQTVALLWVFFQRMCGRALLVVPVNVVPNWVDEFHKWLPKKNDPDYRASRLNAHKVFMAVKGGRDLARVVDKWMTQDGAVLVMSYDLFIRAVKEDVVPEDQVTMPPLQNPRIAELSRKGSVLDDSPMASGDAAAGDAAAAAVSGDDVLEDDSPEEDAVLQAKTPAAQRERVRRALLNGPSLVVADEAHQMKNSKSQKCRMMREVSTMRRLALTGYPLQNKLEEYYQMILWVQPEELFMSHRGFKEKFIKPITEGQQPKAKRYQRTKMAEQLSVLHDLTASFIQRAGPEILVRDLPPKHEYVLALAPTPTQADLLQHFLGLVEDRRSLFRDYRTMRKILDTRDHGYEDLKQAVEAARSGRAARLEVADAAAGAAADDRDNEQQLVVQAASRDTSRRNVLPLEVVEALLQQYPQQQQQQGLGHDQGTHCLADDQPSGTGEAGLLPKEIFSKQLIKIACVDGDEKVVIFSESLTVLDALEVLLQHEFGYKLGRQYVRLEGKTGAEERRRLIRKFNHKPLIKVFLISTLAGSVGINLVAAHRMVLYDMPWNPVHNKQAVSRIWRYGQTQPCFMYHLMYSGTVEQHMYEQTLAKLELFERVVERQSKRAASEYVSEQLQNKAYMLQQVTPLSDSQLVERLDVVLSKPPAAGSSSGVEGDKVLKQILQQPAVVKALALVDLKNHEEQLKDDPSAALNKEAKRKAVLAFERERRKVASYHSAAAATQPATQVPLGAAGISDRTQRYERRRQMRLEQLYGKNFTQEVQQPEPVPAAMPAAAEPAAAWPAPLPGSFAAGGSGLGPAAAAAAASGLAAGASAAARMLGLDGIIRNSPVQRQQQQRQQQARYVQLQQQSPSQQQQQVRLPGMATALQTQQQRYLAGMAVQASHNSRLPPQQQQQQTQQLQPPMLQRANGMLSGAAANGSPTVAAAGQAAFAAATPSTTRGGAAAAAAGQMIMAHGLDSIVNLVGSLARQLPRTSQRGLVTQWLQRVAEGRMTGVQLWCEFTALQGQVQQQAAQQQQAQSPVQQQQQGFMNSSQQQRLQAPLQQQAQSPLQQQAQSPLQQHQHQHLLSPLQPAQQQQLGVTSVGPSQQQRVQVPLQQQVQSPLQQQLQSLLQQQQQHQQQQQPGLLGVGLSQQQQAPMQQLQQPHPGLPDFEHPRQEDWLRGLPARASLGQQALRPQGATAAPPPTQQVLPQGPVQVAPQHHIVLPSPGTERPWQQLLSAAQQVPGTATMGAVGRSPRQAPVAQPARPAAVADQQPAKRIKQERRSYGTAARPVGVVPDSDVVDLTLDD